MSSEAPPTYNVSIFIPSYWADQIDSGFDKEYADTHYLKFPIGQGTEYIPDLVVSGTTTLGSTSASSLNMGGGNITNVTNINGSAYPQAAGINAVLATGNTAVNKDMVMAGTLAQASNNLLLNGDGAHFYNTSGYLDTGTLKRDTLTMSNTPFKSILYSTGLNTLSNATAPTINNSFLSSGSLTITGSTASITNTLTPTSSVIADETYTATLTSNALSLFTNSVATLRNAISNTGMTITGSTGVTNTLTSLSNTITDATRTLLFGISSSVATIKLNASSSGGNSTLITPNSITNYSTDGATTNISNISNTGMTLTGSTSSVLNTITASSSIITNGTTNATIDATNCLVSDTTNNRYALLTSNGSGTAVGQSNKPTLYLGTNAPSASATSSSAVLITNSLIASYYTNITRTTNFSSMEHYNGIITDAGATNATKRATISCNGGVSGIVNVNYCISNAGEDFFTATGSKGMFLFQSVANNTLSGVNGVINNVYKRAKQVASSPAFASITAGDYIGMNQYFGYSTSSYVEYARQSTIATNVSSGNEDGTILFQTAVNGTLANILELNGAEEQINAFKPLDMNNNSIVSSTGGITLDTTSSASGNPYITLTPKSSTGYIILNNLTIASTGSGLPTGAIYKTSAGVLMVA